MRNPLAVNPQLPNADDRRADALYGVGATSVEKNLARAAGGVGALVIVVVVFLEAPALWAWWQYLVAAILAFDLVGGVVANALNSAKRSHFGADVGGGLLVGLTRRPVLFAALHVQPILVGVLFPGTSWWWGVLWWAATLLGVCLVGIVPLYLKRPVAFMFASAVLLCAPLLQAPPGFWWLPGILALKLVVAHAVPEKAYGRRTRVVESAGEDGAEQ